MENNETIDTKSIIIEELELELNLTRENLIEKSNKLEECENIIASLKKQNESNEKKINELNSEIEKMQNKLQLIENSRSYKVVKKIKKILGDKK